MRGEKTCPICGKWFRVPSTRDYPYKVDRMRNGKHEYQVFCSYGCKNTWLEQNPATYGKKSKTEEE